MLVCTQGLRAIIQARKGREIPLVAVNQILYHTLFPFAQNFARCRTIGILQVCDRRIYRFSPPFAEKFTELLSAVTTYYLISELNKARLTLFTLHTYIGFRQVLKTEVRLNLRLED
jgi:hypothetical protein